jgi:hypothetical protein
MLDLDASSSHLYPGARLRVLSGEGPDAVIRFADGASATARIAGARLSVEGYVTRAGTKIPTTVWQVDGSEEEIRVRAKLRIDGDP